MIEVSTLLSDQVFQLNTFLWALKDLPEQSQVRPVLRDAGYELSAIGRQVLMPSDRRAVEALIDLTGSPDPSHCHPDLWLKHSSDPVQPLIELKARGFSAESTNRRQALKLIAAAVDLGPSLGEPTNSPGHLLYATVGTDASRLAATLEQLAESLTEQGATAAATGVIGLAFESEGVTMSSPNPGDLPRPLSGSLEGHPVVLVDEGENDVQPLYFIPWIPGIKDSQNAELHAAGMTELTARVLAQLLSKVGQVRPSATLELNGAELLGAATFGVFRQWRDRDRRDFVRAVDAIVEQTLDPVVTIRHAPEGHLEVDLPNPDVQEAVIDRIERADPSDPSTNLQDALEEQLTLFTDD